VGEQDIKTKRHLFKPSKWRFCFQQFQYLIFYHDLSTLRTFKAGRWPAFRLKFYASFSDKMKTEALQAASENKFFQRMEKPN